MYQNTNLEKLLLDSDAVTLKVENHPLPDYPKAVHAYYDYQFIADVPLAKIRKVFELRDKYVDIYPRLIEYKWTEISDSGNGRIILEDELVGVNILGIQSAYHYILRTQQIDPGKYSGCGMFWQLEKSLDDKIARITGSWYLQEIMLDGRKCTYMRYYNETFFTKLSSAQKGILKQFTGSDMKKMFISIADAARK
ncbi:MAG: hypothetical protein JW874_10900 [Spirochaetales bacterium]|nr:hypothetical protein [Spirochaetales bacterium]